MKNTKKSFGMDGSDMFTIAGFQYGDIYYSILLDLYMFDDFKQQQCK